LVYFSYFLFDISTEHGFIDTITIQEVNMHRIARVLVYGSGVYNLLFVAFHVSFWKLPGLNWAEELPKLSLLNAGVMQVMNFSLIALFFIMAFLSFVYSTELLTTPLGRALLTAFALFWLARFVGQFIFFGYRGPLPAVFFIGFLLYCIPAVMAFIMARRQQSLAS
jgi:hypothetical protein